MQVAPAEVEQTLLLHPDVQDAAVVGFKMLVFIQFKLEVPY